MLQQTDTELAPSEDRLRELVGKLDLDQKVGLLTGADFWSVGPEPAVGLRRLVVSDGPAGVRGELWDERTTSANVPSPTALAATWDRDRIERIGRLLAAECRRKGVDVLLAPTVNLHRTAVGGRNFELFSEDPVLTTEVGRAYVRGVQSEGVGATAKHFLCNESETARYSVDVRVSERALREVYLPPFEALVRQERVWAVMAAYNGLDGSTMTESPLLREILQQEWGFDGVTMSDWGAARSTEASADAGLDLVMPGPSGPWGDALVAAVRSGRVSEDVIDDKVVRLLRLAGRVGALADVESPGRASAWRDGDVRDELRSTAAAGFVLLRNARSALPLEPASLGRLAVIGPNAAQGRTLGGGSALVFPPYVVSPLDGLRAALGSSAKVDYALGVRAQSRIQHADIANLSMPESGERGVEVRFLDRDGALLGTQHRYASAFNFHSIDGIALDDVHAFELRCTLTAPTAGEYTVGASGVGSFLLTIDGEEAFDAVLELDPDADPVEGLMAPPQHGHPVELAAGQQVEVVLRCVPAAPNETFGRMLAFQLNADLPYGGDDREIENAVALAASSDAAVVVVGTTEEVESEGFDRATLGLPGPQDELVRRVAAVNERTVVVVNSGAPVLMPWRDDVAAVLVAWFPGQEFGNALADVVLGAVEPGGRLPTTWPAERDDTPPSPTPVDGELAYDEGLHIGYRRYLRATTRPAYWFGHGLGYTRWEYLSATVESRVPGGGARVTVDVRNVGERRGCDVVQVYLARPDSGVERPGRWLAGHAVVDAAPGESATVVIDLPLRRFAHWETSTHAWAVEPGAYDVLVGASVDAIHCTAIAELPGGAAS